ncbi:hypothetical protein PRVXT_000647 [Proteinivorax tanatarense]|uniref:DUF5673 domain-containing protein n=1 Tax=Proteinivorax tanatarense TaxID=1260629 RepID=A0AAU7VNT1_9FIRM
MHLIDIIFLLIGIGIFVQICLTLTKQKKYAKGTDTIIPGVMPYYISMFFSIAALVAILYLVLFQHMHWTMGLWFVALILLTIQPNKINFEGIFAKGRFYLWKEIDRIVISKNSTVLKVNLVKKRFPSKVSVSVKPEKIKEIVSHLENKPVKIEKLD